MTLKRHFALGLAALLACAAPAAAQLPGGISLPGVGGALPSGLPTGLGSPIVEPVRPRPLTRRPLEVTGEAATSLLAGTYEAASRRLLTQHPDVIEPDDNGQPVVRGEILALAVDPDALRRLRQAGFGIRKRERLPGIGLEAVVLGAPRDLSTTQAIRRLRELDPDGQYDFNHLYLESGGVDASTRAFGAATANAMAPRIGLVDGSVAAGQPALAGARLIQRPFASGGAVATAHATAVASLIAEAGGGTRGTTLYVADIYGATPSGGSALALSRGLAWLAEARVPVINVSLVGPHNLLLAATVKALVARGHLVVAPVGNDGPAAPPLYPAAYPGVVAVTGVDRLRRVLPEAGRGTHVDFAAPGADLNAAGLDRGLVTVRGTSFAAPIAAGLLARRLSAPDPAAAAGALAALGQEAVDLGPPGPDPVYGRGLVGTDVRVGPAGPPGKSARK